MSDYNFDYVNHFTPEVETAYAAYAVTLAAVFAAEEALNIAVAEEVVALAEADAASLPNHTQKEYQYYHSTVLALYAAEDATVAARTNYDAACASCVIALDHLLAVEAAVMYDLYWDVQLAVYAAEEAEEAALIVADAASLPNHTWKEYQYYHQTVLNLLAAEDATVAARAACVAAATAIGITIL